MFKKTTKGQKIESLTIFPMIQHWEFDISFYENNPFDFDIYTKNITWLKEFQTKISNSQRKENSLQNK